MDNQEPVSSSEAATLPSIASNSKISPSETKQIKYDVKKNELKKCFTALVDRKQVNLDLEMAKQLLNKELEIDIANLPADLGESMPYMLIHHIKTWPGWLNSPKYYSGEITFKNWYKEFITFILNKLDEDIKTTYPAVRKELDEEEAVNKSLDIDQCTQIEANDFSPFSLKITGKASMLNTLVFTDNGKGDVIMKQHKPLHWTDSQIKNIVVKQLITWPYIGVHFICPVLNFSRHNKPIYNRYVGVVNSSLPVLTVDRIQQMKVHDDNKDELVYGLEQLKETFIELLNAIKKIYSKQTDWTPFLAIITESLKDIKEIDIVKTVNDKSQPTIALNTRMLFNIGNAQYFRNKKFSKAQPTNQDIDYTEIIIPRIELIINSIDCNNMKKYIENIQNFKPGTTLNHLGLFSLPIIKYNCNYCKKNFENVDQVIKHLADDHYMDHDFLCIKCKRSFQIFELTKTRWMHNCPRADTT
ncbi:hypothetical protein ABEB36_015354 [Hypothenemus hampei]|uniref:C2H2-type domain-containing protein n=1 Tax=Hypothenemus hampei TaxID=57062 RepID=A0ABD1DZY1_HYPHA